MQFTSKLIEKEEVAKDTMRFHFEKPADFQFKAGQFMVVKLINPSETDAEGDQRTFTIEASPEEADLQLATRMRDTAFKRILKNAEPGLAVQITAPMGGFILHEDTNKPAVFLAGGIGVTPARSIILDATARKIPTKIYLFYANKTTAEAAFFNEFQQAAKDNPNFIFIPIVTRPEEMQEKWTGETGHLNIDMIKKYVGDEKAPIYYIAGPPAMVETLKKILVDAHIGEEHIKTENFPGYK